MVCIHNVASMVCIHNVMHFACFADTIIHRYMFRYKYYIHILQEDLSEEQIAGKSLTKLISDIVRLVFSGTYFFSVCFMSYPLLCLRKIDS